MQEKPLTPAESELEAALRTLLPTSPLIDRDRLMFQAGRSSARRHGRAWMTATLALAVALGVYAVLRPAPRGAERIVYVQADMPAVRPPHQHVLAAATPDAWRDQGQYLKLLQEVLTKGADALPGPESPAPARPAESLEKLLGSPLRPAAGRGWLGFRLTPGEQS